MHPTSPNNIHRLGVYGAKLRQAHLDQITKIAARQAKLESLNTKVESQIKTLQAAQISLANQQASLLANRQERRTNLRSLNSTYKSSQAKSQALAKQIQELADLVNRLTPITIDAKLIPFSKQRGRLTKPVDGRVVTKYGTRREGKLNWQGQRIAGDASAEVKAVADGQVVFSGWLKGQGLITIIDHGDSYISLYGNAEVSYTEVGEWITKGDTIARLSEFQQDATLYFELRKNGRPFNPRNWYR